MVGILNKAEFEAYLRGVGQWGSQPQHTAEQWDTTWAALCQQLGCGSSRGVTADSFSTWWGSCTSAIASTTLRKTLGPFSAICREPCCVSSAVSPPGCWMFAVVCVFGLPCIDSLLDLTCV